MADHQSKRWQAEQGQAKQGQPAPGQPAWRSPPVRRSDMRRRTAVAPRVGPLAPIRWLRALPRVYVRVRTWSAVVAALALVALLSLVLTSDYFRVSPAQVQVRGSQRVAAERIYAASQLDGKSVFAIRPAQAAGAVRQLPGIAAAQVHLRLPGQVLIDVRESTPFVAWRIVTDTVWLDANGTVVPKTGDPPPLKLADLSGAARDDQGRMRQRVLLDLQAISAARPDLNNLYFGAKEGIYYAASEGWTVYLGEGGSMPRKLALLQATSRAAIDRAAPPEIIDLRFDDRAYVR